jgi:ribosomal protein S1
MSFSLKQAGPDPWKTAAENYPVESVVNGTVTRVVDFGAFVELEPGLEGLVHVSELSDQRVRSVNDIVKIGESVKVRVIEVDPQARRVSLSIKRAKGSEVESAEAAKPPPVKKRKTQLRGGLDF